jgi:outer membrane lipoprotein-sorting protein
MKRHRMILLSALALLVGFTARASAQTADEIVEKHLTALGGREALGKLKSRAVTGTVTISSPAGDFSGPIESYFKAPNKSRTHMKVDLSSVGAGELEIDQRFDGTTGFMINTMQGNSEITGNQLDNLRNNVFPSSLLNYKAAGTKVEVLPKEKVDGKDAVILLITPKTGSPVRMSLDAESYLPIRTVTTIDMPQIGGPVEQTAEFSDYRDVDGVKVAFMLRLSNMAQSIAVRVAKVEHNTALDDAMFIR